MLREALNEAKEVAADDVITYNDTNVNHYVSDENSFVNEGIDRYHQFLIKLFFYNIASKCHFSSIAQHLKLTTKLSLPSSVQRLCNVVI